MSKAPPSLHERDVPLSHLFSYLAPGVRSLADLRKLTNWPPDVFAIAGYLLHKTGAYQAALNDELGRQWPNIDVKQLEAWGGQWRRAVQKKGPTPVAVQKLWELVLKHQHTSVRLLRIQPGKENQLVRALLDLIACADAACAGLGLPYTTKTGPDDKERLLMLRAAGNLALTFDQGGASSMCEKVVPAAVCVLPRLHTPQVGFTFRSLTHHLALWPSDELAPFWFADMATPLTWKEHARTHLLLIPHPDVVKASQFSGGGEREAGRHQMDDRFRRFDYSIRDNKRWLEESLPEIVKRAKAKSPDNRVDGVILPELSLGSAEEFQTACEVVLDCDPGAFVVAGTASLSARGAKVNTAQIMVPLAEINGDHQVMLCQQTKQHRWLLERGQIERYKLGQQLESALNYWEDTALGPREVNFFPLKRSLTMCVLVCEDLARQEPAGRLIRAVGPHLTIALLMDGPQVAQRWSGRYAAVLAEDPGCSVLTLTSRGMAWLGNERKRKGQKTCIGLWRDSASMAREILMPASASGMLLSLERQRVPEFSADGRNAEAYSLRLAGLKDIRPV